MAPPRGEGLTHPRQTTGLRELFCSIIWNGDYPTRACGPYLAPPPGFVHKVLLKRLRGLQASPALGTITPFHKGILEVGASALPPRPQTHRIQIPRAPAPLPLTSSFLSSDSKAFRSSSFRMIALSSAILSWKRRASFSSNCCS